MDKSSLEMIDRLRQIGISLDDALALRRIAMTLHRWSELECGNSNDYASWCLVRGYRDEQGVFQYDDDAKPYMEHHNYITRKVSYYPTPDRERGAQKRLAKIVAKYPELSVYLQGDPRGAPVYIIRPGDVPKGEDVGSYYTRGVAVYS